MLINHLYLRRKGDSNPRYHFTWYTHFPGVRLRPLGHFSEASKEAMKNGRQNTKKIKLKREPIYFFEIADNCCHKAVPHH